LVDQVITTWVSDCTLKDKLSWYIINALQNQLSFPSLQGRQIKYWPINQWPLNN